MRFPVHVEGVKLFRVHQVNWNNCVTRAGELLLKVLAQCLHLDSFSQ